MSNFLYGTIPLILVAILGFWFGTAKSFREHKLRVYGDMLPTLVRYLTSGKDTREFNKELVRLWVYADKSACLHMRRAIVARRERRTEDLLSAVQHLIVALRDDIQPWWRSKERKLSPDEVSHFQFEELES